MNFIFSSAFPVILFLVLLLSPMQPLLATEATPSIMTISPGSLVSWPGEEITSCSLGSSTWPPVPQDRCIYPIDLLRESGPLTLVRRHLDRQESTTIHVGDYPYDVQHIQLEDETRVHLSAADLARVQDENRQIARLWSLQTTEITLSLPLDPPLRPLPAGGRFGARRVINGEPRNPHSGADYAAPKGTPVYAVADGNVALTGNHFFAGNSIFIDHGHGLISMFFHLDSILVKDGSAVKRGDIIGHVGATGRATGPHLHLGLRWHGQRIDPALLLASPEALPEIR